MNNHVRHGFTLIELAVVLVIVGLIAGGVLLGRDLITASSLRATVTQVERYKTAMQTFRLKYGARPGDISPVKAAGFGLFAFTGVNAGGQGMGNEDGGIESYLPPCGFGPPSRSTIARPCGEMMAFWRHLSEAGLVEGSFMPDGSYDTTTGTPLADYSPEGARQFFPSAKIGRNNMVRVYNNAQRENWFLVGGVIGIGSPGFWGGPLAAGSQYALTPTEVYQMDSKADDGIASSGAIRGGGTIAMTAAPGIYAILPYPLRYNVDPDLGGNTLAAEAYFKAE